MLCAAHERCGDRADCALGAVRPGRGCGSNSGGGSRAACRRRPSPCGVWRTDRPHHRDTRRSPSRLHRQDRHQGRSWSAVAEDQFPQLIASGAPRPTSCRTSSAAIRWRASGSCSSQGAARHRGRRRGRRRARAETFSQRALELTQDGEATSWPSQSTRGRSCWSTARTCSTKAGLAAPDTYDDPAEGGRRR